MHTKSSIHIAPVKDNSDAHNLRTGKPLDYVKKERTPLNTSEVKETIFEAKKRVAETYQKNVGQKMQAKATPIREGVVNLGKTQDLESLKILADKLEDRFKIKTIQIHIHEDEGHHKVKSGDWKQNRHAHMVFDWTDEKGKSLKLNKADMAEMQSIVADTLGMERGQSSDKKHLNSMAYKVQEMKKDAVQMEKDLKAIQFKAQAEESRLEKITEESKRIFQANIKFTDDNKSLRATNSELKNINSHLIDSNKNLSAEVQKLKQINSIGSKSNYDLVLDVARAEQRNRELEKEVIKVEESKKRAIIATTNDVLKKIEAPYRLTDDFKVVERRGKGLNQGK